MDKFLLRPIEAAELISVSRSRIYQLIASKTIKSVRIGRSVRIPLHSLREWVEEQASENQ